LDRDDPNGNDGIPWTEFGGSRSMVIYNHADWVDMVIPGPGGTLDISSAEEMIKKDGYPISVDRNGRVVNLQRGEGG